MIRIAIVAAVASVVVAVFALTVELSNPRPAVPDVHDTGPDFPRPSAINGCTPARLHTDALPAAARNAGVPPEMPWVTDGLAEITGSLAYLGTPPLTQSRVAVIGTAGVAGHGAGTQIIWWVRGSGSRTLTIAGHRTDSPGSFSQTVAGPDPLGPNTVFPSIVDVPAAGCWTLHVRSGTAAVTLRFQAVDLVG